MPVYFYEALSEAPGRIGIVHRPQGGAQLSEDVDLLAQQHDMVVSLIESHKVSAFRLDREADLCSGRGLEFISFPMIDKQIPQSPDSFWQLAGYLTSSVIAGKSVAVHCKSGIGRSGLIVAATVAEVGGLCADEALRAVEAARGIRAPNVAEQREWFVREFSSRREI